MTRSRESLHLQYSSINTVALTGPSETTERAPPSIPTIPSRRCTRKQGAAAAAAAAATLCTGRACACGRVAPVPSALEARHSCRVSGLLPPVLNVLNSSSDRSDSRMRSLPGTEVVEESRKVGIEPGATVHFFLGEFFKILCWPGVAHGQCKPMTIIWPTHCY